MNEDIGTEIAVLGQKLDSGLEAVNQRLDAHMGRVERLEKTVAENGNAIARLEGRLSGAIYIVGIAAALIGPAVMVIINLITK